METPNSLLPLLILIFPLVGFFINGVFLPLAYRGFAKTSANVAGGVATAFIAASFALGAAAFYQLLTQGSDTPYLLSYCFEWFNFGGLNIPFELKIDKLSGLLVLIITGIGTLIHLYSTSYMHDEECVGRYFSYLNLFCFNMLLLVMGNNLPLLFFGWEGVGLCSYLLIGFWYTDTEKADAGKKAFVVNRIGDLGFLIGMFLLFRELGTLNFVDIIALMQNPEVVSRLMPSVTFICLSLFVGAIGKSAQIPLFVWLPDAMSGPTPVSALHAATMVTAGVYMIARLSPVFELSQVALSVIAHTGAITALFAGSIAIAQTDIKKVLAYSTVSQLGFMFLACGVGAYQTAVFHLMTHAFFKALLFLGSGSVIHACSGEQDMTKMGGLKKFLPHTHLTMLVGSLAISGIPFFSGFFSKDEILYSTIALPGGVSYLFIIGVLTACLTAFYTGRMMGLTFYGNERLSHDVKHHLHESPFLMTFPLYVLAGLAALGGFLGVPHLLGDFLGHTPHILSNWLNPVIPAKHLPLVGVQIPLHEGFVMAASSLFAIFFYFLGVKLFTKVFFLKDLIGMSSFHKVLENKYYVDEIYAILIVNPLKKISAFSSNVIDKVVVDGTVNGLGRGIRRVGSGLRVLQTGDIQSYGLMMMLGLLLVIFFIFKVLV